MNNASATLDRLQRWMQAVVTHHGGVAAGAASADARSAFEAGERSIDEIIRPSRQQTSSERLAIYSHAYVARLLHCLRELFPACRHAVGDDAFDDFALGYLQAHPPRSYTLGNLAGRFVAYLDQTRVEAGPSDEGPDYGVEAWSRFLVELARLEQAIDEVFDGPGTEKLDSLSPDQISSIPPERWGQVTLQAAPCLRVLSFEFPVNDYFAAFRRGEDPELPEPRRTSMAISRRDYVVRRYPLDEVQLVLISAIIAGSTLGDSLATAAQLDSDAGQLAERLAQWFAFWSQERFFTAILLSPLFIRS